LAAGERNLKISFPIPAVMRELSGNMTSPSRSTCLALALALAAASPAYPWGVEGHKALAIVAGQNLTPDARSHVIKILGNDDLGSIAVWMDELRSAFFHTGPLGSDPDALRFNAEFPENGQWHYVDLPLGSKEYDPGGAFSNPHDVVHMIGEAVSVLEGGGDRRITKREALYMVVHFVGDEHQPLHIGNGFYDVGADGSVKLVTDPGAAKGPGASTNSMPTGTPRSSERSRAPRIPRSWPRRFS